MHIKKSVIASTFGILLSLTVNATDKKIDIEQKSFKEIIRQSQVNILPPNHFSDGPYDGEIPIFTSAPTNQYSKLNYSDISVISEWNKRSSLDFVDQIILFSAHKNYIASFYALMDSNNISGEYLMHIKNNQEMIVLNEFNHLTSGRKPITHALVLKHKGIIKKKYTLASIK